MKKMSQHLQERLLLEAKEAHIRGLTKLGEAVEYVAVQASNDSDTGAFSHNELTQVVHQYLWKAAGSIAVYHDLPRIDIEKVEILITEATEAFVRQIERSYEVEDELGPWEEEVPGQTVK